MTEPSTFTRLSAGPWQVRILSDLTQCLGLCPLPGSSAVLVSRHEGFARIEPQTGEVTPLSYKSGDPIASRAVAGLDAQTFALVDIDRIRILELDGLDVVQRASAKLDNPRALAMALSIAAAPDGSAVVVSATNVLQRVTRDGTSSSTSFEADFSNGLGGLAYSPDGATVANGRGDGRIELRDPTSLELRETLEGLGTTILSLAFSPDGKSLAAGDDYTGARRFDLAESSSQELMAPGKLTGLAWLGDGSGFVATALTRAIAAFDPKQDAAYKEMFANEFDRNYFQSSVLVDDRYLVVGAEKAGVAIFDLFESA